MRKTITKIICAATALISVAGLALAAGRRLQHLPRQLRAGLVLPRDLNGGELYLVPAVAAKVGAGVQHDAGFICDLIGRRVLQPMDLHGIALEGHFAVPGFPIHL